MIETPQIVQTDAQLTAVIRVKVAPDQMPHVMGPGLGELKATVAAQGLQEAGPWFTHHYEITPEYFDFEIGVPVTSPVSPAGRVQPGRLPAATVARTVYHGPYEGLPGAWGEFQAWIAAQGHNGASDLWECYVTGPEAGPDPGTWRTQLNRPLITAPAS